MVAEVALVANVVKKISSYQLMKRGIYPCLLSAVDAKLRMENLRFVVRVRLFCFVRWSVRRWRGLLTELSVKRLGWHKIVNDKSIRLK